MGRSRRLIVYCFVDLCKYDYGPRLTCFKVAQLYTNSYLLAKWSHTLPNLVFHLIAAFRYAKRRVVPTVEGFQFKACHESVPVQCWDITDILNSGRHPYIVRISSATLNPGLYHLTAELHIIRLGQNWVCMCFC